MIYIDTENEEYQALTREMGEIHDDFVGWYIEHGAIKARLTRTTEGWLSYDFGWATRSRKIMQRMEYIIVKETEEEDEEW